MRNSLPLLCGLLFLASFGCSSNQKPAPQADAEKPMMHAQPAAAVKPVGRGGNLLGDNIGLDERMRREALVDAPNTGTWTNLGMIALKGSNGAYMQGKYPDGEMHCSNTHAGGEEETWFLIQIDKSAKIYAIQNWRNGQYLSQKVNGCVWANATVIGPAEKWYLGSGHSYGVENAVWFKNVANGNVIGTRSINDNQPGCNGEVGSGGPAQPEPKSNWSGWWRMEPVNEKPSPGRDAWQIVGQKFNDILNKIEPAAVGAVIAAL